jgi:hypothetical protein
MRVRTTTHQFQNDASPREKLEIFSGKAAKAGLIKHVWVGKPRPASTLDYSGMPPNNPWF